MVEINAAVVSEAGGPFELTERLSLDDPRADEIQVRVIGAGVCHTDVAFSQRISSPQVFGHEGAGIVERVGEGVTKFSPGDRVLMSYMSCGSCRRCLRGEIAYCEQMMALNFSGRRADGTTTIHTSSGEEVGGSFFGQSSFATHALAYERNLVHVPDEVSDETFRILAPLGCAVQTGAGAVLQTLRPPVATSILVGGAGGVGLSAVLGAVVSHAREVIVVDVVDERLALAKDLGATLTINGKDEDVAERVRGLIPRGVDFSVDTTGNMAVIRALVESTAAGGTVGLVGGSRPGSELTLAHGGLINGPTIRGIVEGGAVPQDFIPRLVHLHLQGKFPFDRFVETYEFGQIQQAVDDSVHGIAVKPVLIFD